MSDTYECYRCHETFEKARTDDEAMEEALQKFTPEEMEDRVVICDECYKICLENERKFLERQKLHEERMKNDPLYSSIMKAMVADMVQQILGPTDEKN